MASSLVRGGLSGGFFEVFLVLVDIMCASDSFYLNRSF